MMGPTGVGKTEIARRVAKIVDAPFVKVEATRFTEVGYVGRMSSRSCAICVRSRLTCFIAGAWSRSRKRLIRPRDSDWSTC